MTDSVETILCSNCKRDILSTNYVIHDVHCKRNIYLCPKCEEPVNHNQRAEHDEANHVLVFCNKCHTQVEKYLLNKHLKCDCSKRKINCQICDIEIGVGDIVEHEDYCGARTEKCSECGEFVMLKYKQLHIESNHTFIKLSDEPGPSPSWQNGRRTLGNFLPDLQSGLYLTNQSHQKKRLGRGRAKGNSEFTEKEEKTKELTSPKGKKSTGYHRNFDGSSSSHSRDYRRRISGEGSDYAEGRSRTSKDSSRDEAEKARNDEEFWSFLLNSAEGVINNSNGVASTVRTGKERPPRFGDRSAKEKDREREQKQGSDPGNNTDDDSSLALAIQLSEELNGGLHCDNNETIAQTIEENAAVLSEFSLTDKSNMASDKNLSKNVVTGKKPVKNRFSSSSSKSRSQYEEDDSLDDLLKSTGKDLDDNDSLPCQFCNSMYPSSALMSHQTECASNGDLNGYGTNKYTRRRSAEREEEPLVMCEICQRWIPICRFDWHQNLHVRFPRK